MKAITKVALLILMLFVVACGDSSTGGGGTDPASNLKTFYMGDTTTLDCRADYPEFWGKRINVAIDGATVLDVYDSWNYVIKFESPDAVVIMIGGNDLGSLSIFYNDMDALLGSIDVPATIVGILPTSFAANNSTITTMNSYIKDLAAAHGFAYLDFWPTMSVNGFIIPEYTTDGIRLTPLGCRVYLDNTTG